MTVAGDHPHDAEIRKLKLEGWANCEIEQLLNLSRWRVADAVSRMGLTKKMILRDRHNMRRYNTKPLVQKTCPVCRKKHMSDPVIWTCAECKADQDNNIGDKPRSSVW